MTRVRYSRQNIPALFVHLGKACVQRVSISYVVILRILQISIDPELPSGLLKMWAHCQYPALNCQINYRLICEYLLSFLTVITTIHLTAYDVSFQDL